MAKKKHQRKVAAQRSAAFVRAQPKPAPEKEPAKAPPTRVRSGSFCVKSSFGVPFLVVSSAQLVEDLPAPGDEDWKELRELAGCVVQQWEDRGAVVLADFEGEFMGFGGELLTAAFQRTLSVETRTMRPICGLGPSRDMGLLLDLRCTEAVSLTRRLMEGEACLKFIWGAQEDVVSLHHALKVRAKRVVDVQLAFSSWDHRLAMSQMLRRVPAAHLVGLPPKTCIDFAAQHAFNRRALHQPLQKQEARYAVDDLHRLDAVIRSQKLHNGSFFQAESQTATVNSTVLDNPASFFTSKLEYYAVALRHKDGLERQLIAVSAKRHILGARGAIPEEHLEAARKAVEPAVDDVLRSARVCVPEDLSFCAQPEESSSEEDSAGEGSSAKGGEATQAVGEGASELGLGGPASGQGGAPQHATKRPAEHTWDRRPRKRSQLELEFNFEEIPDDTLDLWPNPAKKEPAREATDAKEQEAAAAKEGTAAEERAATAEKGAEQAAAEATPDRAAEEAKDAEVPPHTDGDSAMAAAAGRAPANEKGTAEQEVGRVEEVQGAASSEVAAGQRSEPAAESPAKRTEKAKKKKSKAATAAPASSEKVAEEAKTAQVPALSEGQKSESALTAGPAKRTEKAKKRKAKPLNQASEGELVPRKRAKKKKAVAVAPAAEEAEARDTEEAAEAATPQLTASEPGVAGAAAAAAAPPAAVAAEAIEAGAQAAAPALGAAVSAAAAVVATAACAEAVGRRKKKKKAGARAAGRQ